MAVASNNSEQEVVGGVQLYTGIAPVKVIAVNPNQAELEEFGIKLKSEPNYDLTLSDQEYQKIVFWVQHEAPDFITRVEILVQDAIRKNKAGDKSMWTNNRGQISWSEGNPADKYDWYSAEGAREAYVGEDTLIEFIKVWANVSNGGDCYLETINQIFKGDVSELKSLVTDLQDNRLRVLLGVKDGKYQNVYTKHFGRLKPKRDDLFIKALNDEYGNFNAEFNTDLVLQRYSPELITADSTESAAETSDDAIW